MRKWLTYTQIFVQVKMIYFPGGEKENQAQNVKLWSIHTHIHKRWILGTILFTVNCKNIQNEFKSAFISSKGL